MALLSVIRRWHFRQHIPIREIERRTGLSRNTIRKYLRADTVEPKFKVPARPSKLDPFAEKLSAWLRIDAGKSRKQRRTAKQMHADLVVLGYDGSYNRVAAFVRAWKADRQRDAQTSGRGTFVPLVFQPGEAFQFDWSEDWAIIAGKQTKLQAAHTKLAHSKAFIVRAYPLQTHEMLFDAMTQAFRVLGGVPQRGIFDNMKTAVDKIGTGKARQVNARFAAMASHYLFEPEFCNPASGWEKGQVEHQVQTIRGRFFQPRLRFASIEELNGWLEAECLRWAALHPHPEQKELTVAEALDLERPALQPMLAPFDGFHETAHAVTGTCLISFDRNRYSVMAKAARRAVQVRAYADRIVVRLGDEVIAEHARHFGRDRTIYDPWHYLPVLANKPGALRNGAPFQGWDLPPALTRLRRKLGGGDEADRRFVRVLAAVMTDGLEAVEAAIREALDNGAVSDEVILNILARYRDPPSERPLDVVADLKLSHPPIADCARYDTVRGLHAAA